MKKWLAMIVALALLALSFPVWAEEDPADLHAKASAAWEAGDYETAVRYLIPLAEMGEIYSMYNLGIAYAKGLGVEQSYAKAAEYFQPAADAGNVDSQFLIGVLYQEGEGVAQSYEQAAHYFQLAADQGSVDAQYYLARLYEDGQGVEQSYENAAEYYRLAADQGDADAQYKLGVYCLEGTGVEQSDSQAAEWFRLAADQGHVISQNNLGCLYRDGTGVEQSYEQAAHYFQLAADQGHAGAQFNLACLYGNGQGVGKSYEKAAEYFQLAADQGDADAQAMLEKVEALMASDAGNSNDAAASGNAADSNDAAKKSDDIAHGDADDDSRKKASDSSDSAKKANSGADGSADGDADGNSRLLEKAAATGMALPELADGESLYIGIADVPDTQQTRLFLAFALSPNGRAIRCLSLYGEALEIPLEGRDPWLIDREVSTDDDYWIDLDQPQKDLIFHEDPPVSVLDLEIDGDTATCVMTLSDDYQDEANDVSGSYSVSETVTLTKVSGSGAKAAIDPPTRAEAEAAGMTLPQPAAGDALYLGAANVSQAEAMYVAFTLSADGAILGNLTVFIKDMEIEYRTDKARVTINNSTVKSTSFKELPVESEIVSGNVTLSDFTIDGDAASAVLRYIYHVDDDNVDFPLDPAQVAFAKVD